MTIHEVGMHLHVVTPKGSNLEIHLPDELLDKLEASNDRLSLDDLIVFVDEVHKEVIWIFANNQTIGFIELEPGIKTIEILGMSLYEQPRRTIQSTNQYHKQ